MSYEELKPRKSLENFIKRFWKFNNPTLVPQQYTILPDGYFDLIIKIKCNKLESVSLFGLWTREVEVEVPANTSIIGICLKPLAAEYILKQNIVAILNSFIILPSHFWNISNIPFDDFQKWVDESSSIILEILQKGKPLDGRKQTLFNLLFESNGSKRVEEISNVVYWSSRQMNRYFKNTFGLTIKKYANILRCASAYTNIREGELFPSEYFYDQAHFIKEIKKHTGHKPKDLHKNKNDRFLQFSTLPKT